MTSGRGPRPLLFNAYRALLAGISDRKDFSMMYKAVIRLLSNVARSQQTILPYSMKALGSYQEVLILLWHFMDANSEFTQHIVSHEDICQLVRVLCFLLWRDRLRQEAWGSVHLMVFTLVLLSSYRDFSV